MDASAQINSGAAVLHDVAFQGADAEVIRLALDTGADISAIEPSQPGW